MCGSCSRLSGRQRRRWTCAATATLRWNTRLSLTVLRAVVSSSTSRGRSGGRAPSKSLLQARGLAKTSFALPLRPGEEQSCSRGQAGRAAAVNDVKDGGRTFTDAREENATIAEEDGGHADGSADNGTAATDNNGAERSSAGGKTPVAGLPLVGPLAEVVVEKVIPVATDSSLGEAVEKAATAVSIVGEFDATAAAAAAVERTIAVRTVGFWVAAAVLFGAAIGAQEGPSKASEYFTGYLLEQSLSVDNLVVFARVLTYGIAGAIVFRAVMIFLGIVTIKAFEPVNLIFASILLWSSYKLLFETEEDEEEDLGNNFVVKLCRNLIPVTNTYDGNKFVTVENGVKMATPLFLTLAVVELSDIVFAVDSIPAVFGVTKDPFIVYTSNIFAIAGLRSLYTIISSSMGDFAYLQPAVAIVLGCIGSKMFADFAGFHISTEYSLALVISILGTGIFLSLRYPPSDKDN
eukprot:SM000007S20797  [mRNA]  locus=s7:242762:246651:- [translate_table: standard]